MRSNNFNFGEFPTYRKYIATNKCHRFTMKVKKENGVCCEDGDGWYRLYWKGSMIENSSFEKGKTEQMEFEAC